MLTLKGVINSREKRSICTAKTTKAWLIKGRTKMLYIELEKNTEIITNHQEREMRFNSVSPDWFKKRLKDWNKPGVNEIRIATPSHPLEVLTGEVCLILEIEGAEYVVSAYRNIIPQGWDGPGGCPSNLYELCHPKVVAAREACEEVLIGDKKGRIYFFHQFKGGATKDIKRWNLSLQRWNFNFTEFVSLPVNEIFIGGRGDAQDLVVHTPGQETRTENVSIVIDPHIASVCVILYWQIKVPVKLSELRLFDGESHWKYPEFPLNRPIRLTPVQGGQPLVIFSSGQDILSADWLSPTAKARNTIF